MWYVYVLRGLKSNLWYTGCTADLRKRFKEHNEGKSGYSKRDTYELIYYEACANKKDVKSYSELT